MLLSENGVWISGCRTDGEMGRSDEESRRGGPPSHLSLSSHPTANEVPLASLVFKMFPLA